mmetsp:Transcript_25238/g.37125  ORF Transcript_25238/g.37125 Transcript_25238/m.37125 type:complete len:95 (-) Transcript_25238:37-321(-)
MSICSLGLTCMSTCSLALSSLNVAYSNVSWCTIAPCHSYEYVTSPMYINCGTHMNASCHAHELVIAQARMNHVTHIQCRDSTDKGSIHPCHLRV